MDEPGYGMGGDIPLSEGDPSPGKNGVKKCSKMVAFGVFRTIFMWRKFDENFENLLNYVDR
jgi:hypothetical protein